MAESVPLVESAPLELDEEQHSALRGLIDYLTHQLSVKPQDIYEKSTITRNAYNNYMRAATKTHGLALRDTVLRISEKHQKDFREWAKSLLYIVSRDKALASKSDLLSDCFLSNLTFDKKDITNFLDAYSGVYKIYRYAAHLDKDYHVPEPDTRISDLIKGVVGGKSAMEWSREDRQAIAAWSDRSLKQVIGEDREKIKAHIVVAMMQIVNEPAALPGFVLYYRRSNAEEVSRTEGVIIPLREAVYFYGAEGRGGYPLVLVTGREEEKFNRLDGMVLRRQERNHAIFAARIVLKRLSLETITVESHKEIGLYLDAEISSDIEQFSDELFNDVKLYGKATLTTTI